MARGDGRLFKYPGSEVWWVAYYAGTPAREVRESSGSKREQDARRLLRARLGDKEQGRPLPVRRRTTFEDLAAQLEADYRAAGRKSWDRAKRSLWHLRQSFGGDRAEAITADRLTAYVAARLDAGAARATVRNELAALKRAFTLALRAERITKRPAFPTLAVNNARQGFFEDEDLRRVVEYLPDHIRPVVLFLYLTGWRKGEVLSLQWRQVDLDNGTVRLEPGTTKTGGGRLLPVSHDSELDALLRARRAATTAQERATGRIIPWVFHREGKPVLSFRAAWLNACERAGVPGRLVHDLRRTAVRNLVRSHAPEAVAMRLVGMKTRSIFDRYHIVPDADLREAVDRLAAWQVEQRSKRATRD